MTRHIQLKICLYVFGAFICACEDPRISSYCPGKKTNNINCSTTVIHPGETEAKICPNVDYENKDYTVQPNSNYVKAWPYLKLLSGKYVSAVKIEWQPFGSAGIRQLRGVTVTVTGLEGDVKNKKLSMAMSLCNKTWTDKDVRCPPVYRYDCIDNLRGGHSYELFVKHYPVTSLMNPAQEYFTTCKNKFPAPANWIPKYFKYESNVDLRYLKVYFISAPAIYNFMEYKVELCNEENGKCSVYEIVKGPFKQSPVAGKCVDDHVELLNTKFLDVVPGFYRIRIRPVDTFRLTEGECLCKDELLECRPRCRYWMSRQVKFISEPSNFVIPTICAAVILVVIIIVVSLVIVYIKKRKTSLDKIAFTDKDSIKILILESMRYQSRDGKVDQFIKYLRDKPDFEVLYVRTWSDALANLVDEADWIVLIARAVKKSEHVCLPMASKASRFIQLVNRSSERMDDKFVIVRFDQGSSVWKNARHVKEYDAQNIEGILECIHNLKLVYDSGFIDGENWGSQLCNELLSSVSDRPPCIYNELYAEQLSVFDEPYVVEEAIPLRTYAYPS
ncbi:uncharacterized protein LOC141902343 [Tubulanus polymorphus]|uniref:uncharacterized protein LOC141902343 n=1 Tax=Tubulanus polymorphus TaxID=672921 RepID=UPI003DA4B31C